jgi:hydrogenase expression/formation protein HypE
MGEERTRDEGGPGEGTPGRVGRGSGRPSGTVPLAPRSGRPGGTVPPAPRSGRPSGKVPPALLAELLGDLPLPPEVRLGPAVGEDACAIDVSAGTLVVATDPITFTAEDAGRFSVVVNANDVAVTGARPRWFLCVVLAPVGTTDDELRALFTSLRAALAAVGAHLVGGHTEATPAVAQPVVVGQMLGTCERVIPTGGMREGDVVVQVGPAPVEGAAVLAREATGRLATLDPGIVAAARAALDRPGISVVEPALLAAELGASALHDPTEGGLAAGLHELAHASGFRVRVEREAVLWFEPGLAVCRALGADPWATLASGTLLAAFPPDRVEEALGSLAAGGHRASVLGVAEPGSGVVDALGAPLPWPDRDEVARVLEGPDGAGQGR